MVSEHTIERRICERLERRVGPRIGTADEASRHAPIQGAPPRALGARSARKAEALGAGAITRERVERARHAVALALVDLHAELARRATAERRDLLRQADFDARGAARRALVRAFDLRADSPVLAAFLGHARDAPAIERAAASWLVVDATGARARARRGVRPDAAFALLEAAIAAYQALARWNGEQCAASAARPDARVMTAARNAVGEACGLAACPARDRALAGILAGRAALVRVEVARARDCASEADVGRAHPSTFV